MTKQTNIKKIVQVINSKELDQYPLCLNCGNKLTAQVITPFGNLYSCSECGYDDYGKTIQEKNIVNKKIKYTDTFSMKKPFGDGYYTYKNGVKQSD